MPVIRTTRCLIWKKKQFQFEVIFRPRLPTVPPGTGTGTGTSTGTGTADTM